MYQRVKNWFAVIQAAKDFRNVWDTYYDRIGRIRPQNQMQEKMDAELRLINAVRQLDGDPLLTSLRHPLSGVTEAAAWIRRKERT